jgi:signal transduction histidine kinase/ActR/RegA family two-component response regulator
LTEGAPNDEIAEDPDTPRPIRRELHWDSPPQSPGAVFVNLPYSVLQIVATSAKADLVVVGVFQRSAEHLMEIFLCVPRHYDCKSLIEFKTELVGRVNGTVVGVDGSILPQEFTELLGREPQAFLGRHFNLEAYEGIFFALWLDKSRVPDTAESVCCEAVQSLPMLLSTRIEARKYERLGKRFDAILKMMPQSVVFVDDEVGQVLINPAAAELLNLPSHGEVEPSRVASAMKRLAASSGSRTDPQKWYRAVTGVEEPQEIEEEWVLQKPRCVLHVRSFPVSSVSAHGRLWLYEDVTTDRDACEAIQAANRAKSQFLAMMSHELRTPMTGVLGMLDLLHLTHLVPQQQELVKIMQESAEGLMQVINNILDFCKMEAGRLSLEEIDFSLSDLFEQVVTMHEKKFVEKGLKLDIKPMAGATVTVRGDPVRLRQIVVNLVSNAIRFTENGSITVCWRFVPCPPPRPNVKPLAGMKRTASGSLRYNYQPLESSVAEKALAVGRNGVKASEDKKDKKLYLEVKVADTGVGIAKEQLETVFAAAQAGAPRRDASGTGLGLAICKGLLQLMGGRLLPVESDVGKGTVVTFVLPLLPAEDSSKLFLELSADKPSSAKPPLPPPGACSKEETKTISVLVAEDNKVNQLLIRKIFRHYGHDVELVSNGKLAVEAVQRKSYDLVLMDLQMPVLDGLSATRAIRALRLPTAKVPIYALSADALAPESGPMEETGLDGYLSKPIVWEDMSEVVDKVLASKAHQRDN